MINDKENRIQTAKGVLAGGMVLVGLATGSNPFFTLLLSTSVNVGGNILASVAEKAFDKWCHDWFTANGVLNDDIRQALQKSFDQALSRLERDWQKQHHYNYLKHIKEHDRAQFSLQLIQELRKESRELFEKDEAFALFVSQSQIQYSQDVDFNNPNQDNIQRFLQDKIEFYFGPVESLAEFAKVQLPNIWVLCFDALIRGERGTRAWRACQQLWQSSLHNSLTEIQLMFKKSQSDISEVRHDLKEIAQWLDDWKSDQPNKRSHARQKSIEQALTESLQAFRETIDQHLRRLQEDTQLIIRLFNERFDRLELDFEQVMTNFLQKELLGDQNVNLEQAGHQTDEDIALSHVFVDLPASNNSTVEPPDEELVDGKLPPGILAEIVRVAEIALDPQSVEIGTTEAQPGEQVRLFEKNPIRKGRFVLIGGPGQGKTTTGQLACQLFRAAILAGRRKSQLSHKVLNVIEELKNLCIEEGVVWPIVSRFPVRIILSDFAEKLAKSEEINSLLAYIADRIQAKTNQDVTPTLLRKWLQDYPWFLILDGLDEVPASSNRDKVLTAVDEFWIDASGVNADILVVATTRPQGYNRDFAPDMYQHKYLIPLSTVRAEHYGKRLVDVRYKEDEERRSKVFERLQRALQEETTMRLMRSPLQVTIMTALLGRIGTPPQERWSLFSQYYEVIYQRETERNIPASVILRDYQPDINAIHYQVGLLLQIESEYPERTGAKLSHKRFSEIVKLRLQAEGHKGQNLERLKTQIIEAAANRLVFLVGVEADQIGFEIRSLQEFMAAEALMEGKDDEVRERLKKIAPVAHWRNVFLFAAGKCFTKRQHLRDTIQVICAELNEVDETDTEIVALIKAGSQLAIDLLADGTAKRQPKYTTLLLRQAFRLLDLLPNHHQLGLADVYEPGLQSKYEEELMTKIGSRPPGHFGTWALISVLAEREVAWANAIADKYWPRQINERIDLLNSAIDETSNLWLMKKLNYELLHLSASDFLNLVRYHRSPLHLSGMIEEFRWLGVLFSKASNIHVKLNLPNDMEEVNRTGFFFSFTEIKCDDFAFFLDSDNFHTDWMQLQITAKFVANPSKETLAESVRSLAQFEVSIDADYQFWTLPWPLANILEYSVYVEDQALLANEIERGLYGDIQQWQQAETRWRESGFSLRDLEYMSSIDQPFDRNIDKVGCPFLQSVSITSKGSVSINHFVELYWLLNDLRVKSDNAYFRHKCDDFMALLLSVLSDRGLHLPDTITAKEYIKMLANVTEVKWVCTDILKLVLERETPENLIYLVEAMSDKCQFSVNEVDVSEQVFDTLASAFIEDPKRLGVFNLLSQLAVCEGFDPRIPHQLLSSNRYENGNHCRAALLLQMAQQDWQHFPVKQLALEIFELSKDENKIIDDVLMTIHRRKMTGVEIESLLKELYGHLLENSNWKQACYVWEAMDNSLRQRHSELLDVWADLGLPSGLDKLVQT